MKEIILYYAGNCLVRMDEIISNRRIPFAIEQIDEREEEPFPDMFRVAEYLREEGLSGILSEERPRQNGSSECRVRGVEWIGDRDDSPHQLGVGERNIFGKDGSHGMADENDRFMDPCSNILDEVVFVVDSSRFLGSAVSR